MAKAPKKTAKKRSIRIGWKVKDKTTGFTGTVVARAVYDNGCIQFLVAAQSADNAAPVELWIDEGRLGAPSEGPGGPQHHPPQRHP